MFKRKKKKTGVQTPEYRCPTTPPPPPSPTTSGSNAVKPNPNYVPPASVSKPESINLDGHRTIKCLIKRGTTEDYTEWNPILRLNELAVEYNDNEIVGYKIGDGSTKWSELSYITKFTDVSEFWLYVQPFYNTRHYVAAKIVLNPFEINNYLGGIEECKD